MKLICEKCGAGYDDQKMGSVVRAPVYCTLPGDGGGICRGALRAAADEPGEALDSTPVFEIPTVVSGSMSVQFIPHAGSVAIPAALRALLGAAVMRRGPTYPGGEAEAVLEFRTADERAEFASWIALCGGRLSA